ncbi:MAG: GNAT family N-acetyltransferase [Clostridium sp.]
MNYIEKKISVNNRDVGSEFITIKKLSKENLSEIMELQEKIYDFLDNKELYSPSSEEEFLQCIEKGIILGLKNNDERLIAMGVLVKNGEDPHNYGYDIGITNDELFKVGQIESTVVLPNYRGNGLQLKICKELEVIGKENGCTIMTATASPINNFSVDTFKKLGYEIILEKIKYGGLRRFVLRKDI